MAYSRSLREEELKNKVATDWFARFDTTKIIGNIDFCAAKYANISEGKQKEMFATEQMSSEIETTQSYLWAESKAGTKCDIYESFVQLIMTIGRAKTYEKYLPPVFLGAFDAEKIAFVPYIAIMPVFSQNDFDWTVTASNHNSKEFKQLYSIIKEELEKETRLFYYDDAEALKNFIKKNFKDKQSQIIVTKNNFVSIYLRWLKLVKPSIKLDWEKAKKEYNVLDVDFYLADLLSAKNKSLKDKLFVELDYDKYLMYRKDVDDLGLRDPSKVSFNDNQKAHNAFWVIYKRPPRQEFWNYMVGRRDLLVPQDVRERKGSFFTPEKWVNLSQQYIADVLGENWLEEYYVWDCCAGTGNLLRGLNPDYKAKIWASTLDKADVDVMKDQIKNNNAPLFESHVFQMDFLNDSFEEKCPPKLLEILHDEEKRKKLVIYINPPYAEAATGTQATGTGKNKAKVATSNNTYVKYKNIIGKASNEIFAQFFARVYSEIPGCQLAEFSKLKILQAGNFKDFRNFFQADLKKFFLVPANTFDNVSGQFPIGFFVWDLGVDRPLKNEIADVYDAKGEFMFSKKIICPQEKDTYINTWLTSFRDIKNAELAKIDTRGNDFQNQKYNHIAQKIRDKSHTITITITITNLIAVCIYLSVRQCIAADWLNDRDQFFAPCDDWKSDKEFQSDCLAFALFHGQNHISSLQGINHFIPFTEQEVGAKDEFESHFMTDYIRKNGIVFSSSAQAVIDAGRELWCYYHRQDGANPNASYYDIRAYFQGRDDKGRMKNDSQDAEYTRLIGNLRAKMKKLALKIQPKVYEYGFLKE